MGAISEVAGPESSGRTSLALSFLAGRTQEGLACAWVDAGDALDAESAAASGVNLKQLLWFHPSLPRRRDRHRQRHPHARYLRGNRLIVTRSRFLLIGGKLQNQEGVVHVKAERIKPLLCAFYPR